MMVLIERYRTAGGSAEHHAYKEELRHELRETEEYIQALEQSNGNMASLLERIANSLKGIPAEDTLHSFHDLPVLVHDLVTGKVAKPTKATKPTNAWTAAVAKGQELHTNMVRRLYE